MLRKKKKVLGDFQKGIRSVKEPIQYDFTWGRSQCFTNCLLSREYIQLTYFKSCAGLGS